MRRFLPDLIQLIWDRTLDPGKIFDLTLPLEEAAEGYKAMDGDAPRTSSSPSESEFLMEIINTPHTRKVRANGSPVTCGST